MTIITLHHLCFGHCANSSVIVLDLGIFAPEEKYLGPKQSPPISHNDLKKDGAQLLLSNYIKCYENDDGQGGKCLVLLS